MNSPATDIATILAAGGVGTLATDLFVGYEPTTPDACVTVVDSGGENPPHPLETSIDLERPSVMVKVRGARSAYQTTYAKVQAVKTALDRLTQYDISSAETVISCRMEGDALFLGQDENQRPMWTLNFRLLRTG